MLGLVRLSWKRTRCFLRWRFGRRRPANLVTELHLDTPHRSFHLEEYKLIKSEVSVLLTRVENLFRYSLIVAASIYAWLIVQSVGVQDNVVCQKLPVSVLWPGWLIPPVFVLLAGFLAIAQYCRITQMGTYLEEIENALGSPNLGWEKFLRPKRPVVTGTTIAVWLLLLAASSCATWQGMSIMLSKPPACNSNAART